STVPGSLCPLAACFCKFIMVLGWYSTSSRALAKRRKHLLAEQFNGIPHHRLGDPAGVMVGGGDVLPDAVLGFFKRTNSRLRAADDGQPMLEVELVALGCQTHGLAARLVVGTLAVAAHATGVRAPANARLCNRAAAHAHRTGGDKLARLLVGLGVGLV